MVNPHLNLSSLWLWLQVCSEELFSRACAREKSLSFIGFRICFCVQRIWVFDTWTSVYIKVTAWPISRASMRKSAIARIEVGGATVCSLDPIRAALGML